MAKEISVSYEGTPCYKIKIEHNFCNILQEIKSLGYQDTQKICIVTDSNVAALHLDELTRLLKRENPKTISFTFHAGESNKTLETVQILYEKLIKEHFDRKDLLIAFGGGVVGDLTGFTAATYLRGIDFIQIPTTLLSQVDSSIGGKTGVDFLQYKNMVGAFYQPRLVYMNLSLLNTLPKEEFSSGMAEIIKHGLIKSFSYYTWLDEHREGILELDLFLLEEMIYQSCLIKGGVVERDPKEMGERALLNFGHTIGHAVEKLANFNLSHGQCVSIGIAAASYISCQIGHIDQETYHSILTLLNSFSLPTTVKSMDTRQILEISKSDKKIEAGKIKFILLKKIGNAYVEKNLSDENISTGIFSIMGGQE